MLIVTPEVLNEITQKLTAELNPRQIFLFGSHAWGQPGPDSDLDLMVIVDSSPYSPAKRAYFGHKCLRSLEIPKDIIVRTASEFDKNKFIAVTLDNRVATRGKLLYERPKT